MSVQTVMCWTIFKSSILSRDTIGSLLVTIETAIFTEQVGAQDVLQELRFRKSWEVARGAGL